MGFPRKADRFQVGRMDFDPDALYAPFASHETIRLLYLLVANMNLTLERYDTSNAYLQGDLDFHITMHQPTASTSIPREPNCYCLLKKLLYGEKQDDRIWIEILQQ